MEGEYDKIRKRKIGVWRFGKSQLNEMIVNHSRTGRKVYEGI
ncbi:MAG: hypothetical protein SOZ65_03940 [Erysipelotrichaceae bacterium]|nr:hypothetical protein [Erysipelotrichaceae bacterium]